MEGTPSSLHWQDPFEHAPILSPTNISGCFHQADIQLRGSHHLRLPDSTSY